MLFKFVRQNTPDGILPLRRLLLIAIKVKLPIYPMADGKLPENLFTFKS